MTRVSDVMTRGVRTLAPNDSVRGAAQAMYELDVGMVPICDGEHLVGVVTDRDIVLRCVAQDQPTTTEVSAIMSGDVCWCFEDDSVDEITEQMSEVQIRRMPVIDRGRRLVGVVSLGDVAVKAAEANTADTLATISEPAEPDRSGLSAASGDAGGGASQQANGTPDSARQR